MVNKLSSAELAGIEIEEGVKLDQGNPLPLFIFGECLSYSGEWGKFQSDAEFYFEIDTGSDRTLISNSLALRLGVEVKYFVEAKIIVGVGNRKIKCEKYGIIKMRVRTVKNTYVLLQFLAYIMDYEIPPLMGSDVMASLGCSISYRYKVMRYGEVTIGLETDKVKLDKLIADLGAVRYGSLGVVKFTLEEDCSLRAGAVERVRVKLTADIPEGVHVLLGGRTDVCVVDLVCESKEKDYSTVVINFGSNPITVKRGAEMGYVVMENEVTDIYSIKELLEDEKIMKAVECGLNDDGNANEVGPLKGFPDRRKLTASQLDRFYNNGVDLDLRGEETSEPDVKFPEENIDEEEELRRNREDVKWKDRNIFEQQFRWADMEKEVGMFDGQEFASEIVKELKDVYWDFRANFWDGSWDHFTKARFPDMVIHPIEGDPRAVVKYRRMSAQKEAILRQYVSDLLKAGVIEKVENGLADGFCANPHVLLQTKKDALGNEVVKQRLIIDYRDSNRLCKSMSYRMQISDEILTKAATNGLWFSSYDLANYFWQIPLHERSRRVTAFYFLNEGVMQFTRASQGRKNSPAMSQMCTDKVVGPLSPYTYGFIDDFMTHSPQEEEDGLHPLKVFVRRIRALMLRMSYYRLLIGISKVVLPTRRINFLGFAIAKNSIIRVQEGKVTSLRDLKSPTGKASLRSALGLMSWFASRSPVHGGMGPLREMAKAGVRFNWTPEMEECFRSVLNAILDPSTNCLRAPVEPGVETPFCIFSDAAKNSVGGLLTQQQFVGRDEALRDGLDERGKRLYLIQYYSKSIRGAGILAPISLKELLGLKESLVHWAHLVKGGPQVICFVDSRYVSYWCSLDLISEKVARWLMVISEYNIVIKFLPSLANAADQLSRLDGGSREEEVPKSRNVFKEVEIYDSQGLKISADNLFSEDKRRELNEFFSSSKRSGMANVLRVSETGIILNHGGNSPERGKLRNPFSGRVGRRGDGVSRPTPISSVGPNNQLSVPWVGRGGLLGSGHKQRESISSSGSRWVPGSDHRACDIDTLELGSQVDAVGAVSTGVVSKSLSDHGECQVLRLETQIDGHLDIVVDTKDRRTDCHDCRSRTEVLEDDNNHGGSQVLKSRTPTENVSEGITNLSECWGVAPEVRTDGQSTQGVGEAGYKELEFVRVMKGVESDQKVLEDGVGRVVKRVK